VKSTTDSIVGYNACVIFVEFNYVFYTLKNSVLS
jgi:hypothetical protein